MRTFATAVRQRSASRAPVPGQRYPVPSHNRTSTVQRAAVRQILHGSRLQPKQTVGPPEDAYEREADRVADAVMRMPAPDKPIQPLCSECEEKLGPIQRKCGCLGEDLVQRSGVRPIDTLAGAESKIAAVGGGEPLSKSARAFFESSLDHDLGGVRIHTNGQADAAATAVGARAYTLGNDIVFRKGEYNPDSTQGKSLLAHELVHVIQQGAARPSQAKAEEPSVRRRTDEGLLQRQKDEDGYETAPDPERVETPRRVPDLSREEALRRGREALEVLGYEELIRRAVAAGVLQPATGAEGQLQRLADSDHLQRQGFEAIFTRYAVAAGIASQVDSPAPGPADLVALGILAVGLVHALAASSTTTRRPCPPCPSPPAPEIDRVPPSRPHFPCPGDHWHYFVYNQNPITCQCFLRRMFGGCCSEGTPGAPC